MGVHTVAMGNAILDSAVFNDFITDIISTTQVTPGKIEQTKIVNVRAVTTKSMAIVPTSYRSLVKGTRSGLNSIQPVRTLTDEKTRAQGSSPFVMVARTPFCVTLSYLLVSLNPSLSFTEQMAASRTSTRNSMKKKGRSRQTEQLTLGPQRGRASVLMGSRKARTRLLSIFRVLVRTMTGESVMGVSAPLNVVTSLSFIERRVQRQQQASAVLAFAIVPRLKWGGTMRQLHTLPRRNVWWVLVLLAKRLAIWKAGVVETCWETPCEAVAPLRLMTFMGTPLTRLPLKTAVTKNR